MKAQRRDPAEILRDGDALERAMEAARRRVVLRHHQLGLPLAIWRDGEVAIVSAHEVVLPGEEAGRD